VTGASSGIGRAAAIECSKMGANIVVTGRNVERLNDVFEKLEGGNHQKMICDLLNEDEINQLVDNAPILNGLIVNAGINKLVPIKAIKRSDFDSILQTNVVSSILLLQKFLKAKKIAKGASVVFTSSMAALGETATGNAMYTASKGAITSFVRVAALELAPRGIRVNAICAGEVKTSLNLANVLESDNNAVSLVNEWWTMARQKYGVPKHARFDDVIQEFYECVDENGVPSKTADFVPKQD
jgi:NAD(P)-dependent dehydrogenase (short-subunit alcohol dehydrogenase family)